MVNAVEAFDAKHMKPAEEIPAFRPGDTVDVNVKIQEGNNSRIQTFTGVVIARKGAGSCVRPSWSARSASALVWSVASRCTSPSIDSIKLVRKGRVRPRQAVLPGALCAVRPLVLPSAATTPLSESIRGCNREPDDAGARINREIQPGTVSVSGCFSYFPRMMDGRRHPSYPAA